METADDWLASLDAALAASPEHVSAYALIVEDGTRLAARVRRGELPAPDDDDLSDKYVIAEERLAAAGLTAYEVSNWSSAWQLAAGTIWATGEVIPGGASAPARIAMLAECGGGTEASSGVRVQAGLRSITGTGARGALGRATPAERVDA